LNNTLLCVNEHHEKLSCTFPSPSFKDNFQLSIEPLNKDNKEMSVISNSVPHYVNIMTQKQIVLFKQQLTQHVQLMTQSYLLSTLSKKFQKNCRKFRIMLVCYLIYFSFH